MGKDADMGFSVGTYDVIGFSVGTDAVTGFSFSTDAVTILPVGTNAVTYAATYAVTDVDARFFSKTT